jgi:hypothetical protein
MTALTKSPVGAERASHVERSAATELRVVAYVLGKGVQTDEPLMAICSSSADQLSAGGDHPLQQA